jgi:predicted tellurium resistance membrane protein TerC
MFDLSFDTLPGIVRTGLVIVAVFFSVGVLRFILRLAWRLISLILTIGAVALAVLLVLGVIRIG